MNDVEWKIHNNGGAPGPGEYDVMRPPKMAAPAGGRFNLAQCVRPHPRLRDVPSLLALVPLLRTQTPRHTITRLCCCPCRPKSELDFLLDQARKMPGPGEYDAPRWPCPSEGRFSGQQAGVKMDMYRQSPFPKQHVPRVKSGHQTLVTKQVCICRRQRLQCCLASSRGSSAWQVSFV